jgi:hypothetical protein
VHVPKEFCCVKVKLSLYRPWRPSGLREVEIPTHIFRHSAHRWRQGCQPTGRFLVLISVKGWVDPRVIVRLEGLGKLNKCTSSGIRTSNLPLSSIAPQSSTLPRFCSVRVQYRHYFTYSNNTFLQFFLNGPSYRNNIKIYNFYTNIFQQEDTRRNS